MVRNEEVVGRRQEWKRSYGREQGRQRRARALELQRKARRDLTNAARRLALGLHGTDSDADEGDEMDDVRGTEGEGSKKQTSQWEQYVGQLMMPEWLLEVPDGLASWYVCSRPEGKRCLVIASKGKTTSRDKKGRVLHRFQSALPDGSRGTAGKGYCILDCIYYEQTRVYYVLDAMCWRGYLLYDCTAEFRFYWLESKLAEDVGSSTTISPENEYAFVHLRKEKCGRNAAGIDAAYAASVAYTRDGVLLYNGEGHYQLGISPLFLQWKDPFCSQYVLETDGNGKVPELQRVVLKLTDEMTVCTADEPPVIMGRLAEELLVRTSEGIAPGCLLRFEIGYEGIGIVDGRVTSIDLKLAGKANPRRGGADSFTKIIFQYMARNQPVSIDTIKEACMREEGNNEGNGVSESADDEEELMDESDHQEITAMADDWT